ncbi:MAG: hypothetical protein D4R65_07100 [Verrucomicrobiaceae bacterium]|nr:MAG: hypothetical protein D4R65_07100 [Verrucomicrobiaceae bacterium]
MKSRAASSFWRSYNLLPGNIQKTAEKQYLLWLDDPRQASVQFKKVQGFWSARITDHYRALGIMDGYTVILFWVDPHGDYEKLIRRRE